MTLIKFMNYCGLFMLYGSLAFAFVVVLSALMDKEKGQ